MKNFVKIATHSILFLFLFSHCSKSTVTLNIDILSFFKDDKRQIDYGEDPIIPGYGPQVSVKSPVQAVPIAEEISDSGDMERIHILLGIEISNDTGEAEGEFKIFACEGGLDPFMTTPIIDQTVVIVPDTTYKLDIAVEGDDRLLGLFEKDEIYFAAELYLYPGDLEEDIKGSVLMEKLKAVIEFSSSI